MDSQQMAEISAGLCIADTAVPARDERYYITNPLNFKHYLNIN